MQVIKTPGLHLQFCTLVGFFCMVLYISLLPFCETAEVIQCLRAYLFSPEVLSVKKIIFKYI